MNGMPRAPWHLSRIYLGILQKSANILLSSSFAVVTRRYISVSKARWPVPCWPDPFLGPIGAPNPRYPLPGYVGLLESPKNAEVPLVPAASNLPPTLSNHYAYIMKQVDNYMEGFDAEIKPLVPDIDDNLLECNVLMCPQLIMFRFMNLLPSKNFSGTQMTIITFRRRPEATESMPNLEHLYEIFIRYAIDMCASLKNLGFWADFIHPVSGIPYLGLHSEPNIIRMSDGLTNLGFVIDKKGCCKVLRSSYLDERMFIGMIFTDAPRDHPLFTHLFSKK